MSDPETPEVRAWKPCGLCDGRGIFIGALDHETGERPVRECSGCNGWGIKIDRRMEKALVAIERRATHANANL